RRPHDRHDANPACRRAQQRAIACALLVPRYALIARRRHHGLRVRRGLHASRSYRVHRDPAPRDIGAWLVLRLVEGLGGQERAAPTREEGILTMKRLAFALFIAILLPGIAFAQTPRPRPPLTGNVVDDIKNATGGGNAGPSTSGGDRGSIDSILMKPFQDL